MKTIIISVSLLLLGAPLRLPWRANRLGPAMASQPPRMCALHGSGVGGKGAR